MSLFSRPRLPEVPAVVNPPPTPEPLPPLITQAEGVTSEREAGARNRTARTGRRTTLLNRGGAAGVNQAGTDVVATTPSRRLLGSR